MKNTKRDFTPMETWDQLAVTQIQKQLAPNGFKKIHNGKREVSSLQFLSRQTVNTASLIGANVVRLYRENLRERLSQELKEQEAKIKETEEAIKKCNFWEWGVKDALNGSLCALDGQTKAIRKAMEILDTLKPSAPKMKVTPKETVK